MPPLQPADGLKIQTRPPANDAIQGKRAGTLAIHTEESKGKTCIDCHINLVHRRVPDERIFKREAWKRMVEAEFGLEEGSAQQLLNSE